MKLFATASAAGMVVVLSGCASFFNPVGENKFDCNRRQGGNSEYCKSFKAMNASTDAPLPESRFDGRFSWADYDRAAGMAPVNGTKEKPAAIAQPQPMVANGQVGNLVRSVTSGGTVRPVRLSPVVQRVWVKQFVDSNSDLHGETVVYREVIAARWAGYESDEKAANSAGMRSNYPHFVRPPSVDNKPISNTVDTRHDARVNVPITTRSSADLNQGLAQPSDSVTPPADLDREVDSKPQ